MRNIMKELVELDAKLVPLLEAKNRLIAEAGLLNDVQLVDELYVSTLQAKLAEASKKALAEPLLPQLLKIKNNTTGVVPYPALGLVAEIGRKMAYTYDMQGIVADCTAERLTSCLSHNIVLVKDLAKTDPVVMAALRKHGKPEPGAFSVSVKTEAKHNARFRKGRGQAAAVQEELDMDGGEEDGAQEGASTDQVMAFA